MGTDIHEMRGTQRRKDDRHLESDEMPINTKNGRWTRYGANGDKEHHGWRRRQKYLREYKELKKKKMKTNRVEITRKLKQGVQKI